MLQGKSKVKVLRIDWRCWGDLDTNIFHELDELNVFLIQGSFGDHASYNGDRFWESPWEPHGLYGACHAFPKKLVYLKIKGFYSWLECFSTFKGQGFNRLESPKSKVHELEHLEIKGFRSGFASEQYSTLRSLTIDSCWDLQTLPRSLGYFKALEHLTIINCKNLKDLPDSLVELQALKALTIRDCRSLKSLPDCLGALQALKALTMFDCDIVEALPDSIGQLNSLHLTTGWCWVLKDLPKTLGQLKSLHLTIMNCGRLEDLPDTLGQIKSLHLTVKDCWRLKDLPESLKRRGFSR